MIENIHFYVSPSGSDENSGTLAAPFQTLARAQKAARATSLPVTVEVLEGIYRETLSFDARDTADTYITHTRATLTAGISVPYEATEVPSRSVLSRFSPDAAPHIRVIDLARLGISPVLYDTLFPIGTYTTDAKYDGYSRGINLEVFEDDRRMTLARYPNDGYLAFESILDAGDCREFPPLNYWKGWDARRNHRGGTYIIDEKTNAHIKRWKTPETAWMFGYFYFDWADMSTPIQIQTENCAVFPRFVSQYGARPGALYYLYNVLEELDAPGEYYLDRETGLLYVYPTRVGAVFEISLACVPLITLDGVKDLTVSGFALTSTRESAVVGACENCTLHDLYIKNVAAYGIDISGKGNTVDSCEITRTGRGGIRLTGGDTASLTPGENRAINNYVHDFSEVYKTYQWGIGLYGVGNVCAHNEIVNSPHAAIGYYGNDHLIEYNDIHEVVLHSTDAGAIYAGQSWVDHGTVIRYNLLRNIGGEGFEPDGIYWDDGLSGQCAYGNILMGIKKCGFLIGGGRDNTVCHNIIIGECMNPILYDDRNREGFVNGGWAKDACITREGSHWKKLDSVPYRSEIWAKKYPTLARLVTDFEKYNDPDFPINPANSVIENNIIINQEARLGLIEKSVYDYGKVGENHCYHSCEEADFDIKALRFCHVRPDFPDIPVHKIGRSKK